MEKIERSFGTHDGHFHGDEVTACALLIVNNLIDEEKIFRTRDKEILSKCDYICDVEGEYDSKKKIFDHHQQDYLGTLSSAGMILIFLKEKGFISEKLHTFLNNTFVKGVDDHDNGNVELKRGTATFSEIIESFVPLGNDVDTITMDKAFLVALQFTKNYLKRLINKFYYLEEVKKIVKEKMKIKEKLLIFDKAISWLDSFFELGGKDHPALFIIMPSGNNWKLRAIPPSYEKRMQMRLPLPERWAGLRDDELKKISHIPGAIFCHKNRFISIWKTKEDALLAFKYIMKENNLD